MDWYQILCRYLRLPNKQSNKKVLRCIGWISIELCTHIYVTLRENTGDFGDPLTFH